MPLTAPKIWTQLGIADNLHDMRLTDAQQWGRSVSGTVVTKPEPIFPRIEEDKEEEAAPVPAETVAKPAPVAPSAPVEGGEISIDEFAKMDLRVASVVACEKVKGADKLLLLTVDLGYEQRTVVSGIAQHYTPEELVGKSVVLVANLKPAKIRGIESRGMVLAGTHDNRVILVDAPGLAPGSKVK